MQRHAELPHAYTVLGREVARFTDWLRRREAVAVSLGAARPSV